MRPTLLALCWMFLATSAHADPVILYIEGRLTTVSPSGYPGAEILAQFFDVGDPFSFVLTYDDGPPIAGGSSAAYFEAGTIVGAVNGYRIGTSFMAFEQPGSRPSHFFFETFPSSRSNNFHHLPNGWGVADFWNLLVNPGQEFGSMPTEISPEAQYQVDIFYHPPDPLWDWGYFGGFISGQSTHIHRVPEPATWMLVGLGAVGFWRRRR